MKPFISTIPEPLRPLYEHKQPLEVRPAECARTPFVGAVVVAHPPITQVRAALGEGSPRPRARELDQVPPAYPLRPQGARAAARLHLRLGPSGDIGVPARDWDVGAEDANGVAVAHHALPPSFQAGRGVGLPRHVRAVAGGERNECKKCDAAPAFLSGATATARSCARLARSNIVLPMPLLIWGCCYCSFLRTLR
jgi:hypothetical protein